MNYRMEGLRKRCGCSRKKWKDCEHPWYFEFCHDGTEHKFSLHRHLRLPRGSFMSKEDAEEHRDRLRREIKAGTFEPRGAKATEAAADHRLTFGDVANLYLDGHVRTPERSAKGIQIGQYELRALRAVEVPAAHGATVLLEAKPFDAVTKADIEAIRAAWRLRPGAAKGNRVGANRVLRRVRSMFNWAIREGHVEHTPFKKHGVTMIQLDAKAESPRERRLHAGEEERLLQHAVSTLIKDLIIAALETGCRRGELLSLQWSQVSLARRTMQLVAAKTKTAQARAVPIIGRLKAILEMRRFAPDGTELPDTAYVFGNEVGEPVSEWTVRQAWDATCAAANVTGLHFHDLRRECGSRLLEAGVPIHQVRAWLGHATVTMTNRYLATSIAGMQDAARSFEHFREAQIRAEIRANAPNTRNHGPSGEPTDSPNLLN